jgi:hypothetical protein
MLANQEIRFPIGLGVVGCTATMAEPILVKHAKVSEIGFCTAFKKRMCSLKPIFISRIRLVQNHQNFDASVDAIEAEQSKDEHLDPSLLLGALLIIYD